MKKRTKDSQASQYRQFTGVLSLYSFYSMDEKMLLSRQFKVRKKKVRNGIK